jgi:hypothetical protein
MLSPGEKNANSPSITHKNPNQLTFLCDAFQQNHRNMRTFVMGDIHGNYRALQQCLDRSGYKFKTDKLIQLGDITDGYNEVYQCVELLLQIKNLVTI